METTGNRMDQGLDCTADASSLQFCVTEAILAQKQQHAAEHCIDKESTLKDALTSRVILFIVNKAVTFSLILQRLSKC